MARGLLLEIVMSTTGAPRRPRTAGEVAIATVMTPDVVTVLPEAPVAEAIRIFCERPFRHLPVVDPVVGVVGIVADGDALRLMARGRDTETTRIDEIMKRDPILATPETSIPDAIELMRFHNINCLPVVDPAHRISGIVTSSGLLVTLYRLLRRPGPWTGDAAAVPGAQVPARGGW